MDPESEALVNANLTRIGRGRTMVIVSHRLASLVECDLILVMDKGKVVDVAPHTTLLERLLDLPGAVDAAKSSYGSGWGTRGAACAGICPGRPEVQGD